MIEVRVLGPLRISASDGRDLGPLVRQARRAALLAYLAAATPRDAQRRDRLLALFWPESDQAHARAALNQAVYVLRSTLGDDAVAPRGDGQLGLAPDRVWCDVVAFEEALDAGRAADALALYRGDLLDGFFISGAPEFERWLDEERQRLRQRAAEGAWQLAEASAAAGTPLEAQRWARQALKLSPVDEAALRRLMRFEQELGDRAAAIRAYEAFAWRLAEEYELEPSAETRQLAAAIREPDVGSTARGETIPTSPGPQESAPRWLPVEPPVHKRTRISSRLTGVAVATTVIAAAWASFGRTEHTPPLTRVAFDFAGVPPLVEGIGGAPIALSPDGRRLVYLGVGPEGRQLFLRAMDQLNVVPLAHTVGARLPFFSPDGEWLGFVVGSTIRKVPLRGGPAITVVAVDGNIPGASWGPRDVIVYATPAGLWQVPAAGGVANVVALSDTASGERYRWPHVLPGGRSAVFTRVTDAGFELAAVSLRTGAVTPLGVRGTKPEFVPPGHLVFARADGALLTVSFDPASLRVNGQPLPVADSLLVGIAGDARVSAARTGALAYVPDDSDRSLVIVDTAGAVQSELPFRRAAAPRFSPDGRHVAAGVKPPAGELPDLWLLDLDGGAQQRMTFGGGSVGPTWSPDGRRVAFSTKPGGILYGWSLQWAPVDGSEPPEVLLPPAVGQFPDAFTPDGRALLYRREASGGILDIWILPLEGAREPIPYSVGLSSDWSATVSPDGRRVAYVSDDSGREEVYVGGFPTRGVPRMVSAGGGREPRWSRDGQQLFLRSPAGMVALRLEHGAELRVVERTVLFDDRAYLSYPHGTAWDVHPDGRFLMIRRGSGRGDVVVVLNLFEQLGGRRRQEGDSR